MATAFRMTSNTTARLIREGLPEDYLVWDIETTGFNGAVDLTTQIGWAIVRNRQLVNQESLLLDWTTMPGIDQQWLRDRLAALCETFRERGSTYHATYDKLAGGQPPLACLQILDTVLTEAEQAGDWIVGHNVACFDTRLTDGQRARFLGLPPRTWNPDRIFDTGLFVKAAQASLELRPGEALGDWWRRVAGTRVRVKWALDTYCIPAFGLAEKYGLDLQSCHDAGYDCYVIHCLVEELRKIGNVNG